MANLSSKKNIRDAINSISPALLLSITAVLFAYGRAIVSIPPAATIRPIIFVCTIVVILYLLIYKSVDNQHVTGLLLVVFAAGFYMVEQLFYLTAVLGVLMFITTWLTFRILKKRLKTSHIPFLLYTTASVLLLFVATQFISPLRQVNWTEYRSELHRTQNSLPAAPPITSSNPDIYYIVLDAYARADILQEYYQYNNSEFISYLTEKGFIVPQKAHSNYPYTALSVSSTLNMDYMENISSGMEKSHFWWLMEPYIFESRTQLYLEQAGYQSIFLASDWHITDNRNADQYFTPHIARLNEFEGYMLGVTPLKTLKPLLNSFISAPSHDSHRELIAYSFKALADISKIAGPKFVFSHIITPHPPFVFDRLGNPVTPAYGFSFSDGNDYPGTDAEYQAGYVEQLQYTNTLLKETIEAILSQSQTPPIIILQADHGPRMLGGDQTQQNLCIRERFSIFAAYYLSGLEYNPIPDEISSVNIFRFILNEYFQTELPILKNEAYLPVDKISIYQTKMVQTELQNECIIP